MVSNTTQHPTPLPATCWLYYIYVLYFYFGKGGGVGELNQREGQRGNSSQSWGENTNMADYSTPVKPTFSFGFFIVN